MGGVSVSCLVDTGSTVTTITESCFRQHFEPWGQDHLRNCQWLQLRAANGLTIPYMRYLELDVEICGRLVVGCGVLVVRDPPGGISVDVPGVLGMNILGRCYKEFFGQHDTSLFDLPVVTQLPSVSSALQYFQQVSARERSGQVGCVRVRGRGVCRIPGGTIKLVAATCSAQYFGSTVLFEPTESGLPAGLLASPALVRVIQGTVYVPVVNVGTVDVTLRPTTVVGNLREVYIVSLPTGVVEVKPVIATVQSHSVVGSPSLSQQMESLDLSALSKSEQAQVRPLVQKYKADYSVISGVSPCSYILTMLLCFPPP